MIFGHFRTEVNEANAFIVGCEETGAALLVDVPVWDARFAPFLRAHGLTLAALCITHNHYDHIGGIVDALQFAPVPVYAGTAKIEGVAAQKVAQGTIIRFGNIAGTVVLTPGHTPDSISLILPGMVFTGDALFAGSVGGTTSEVNADRQCRAVRDHLFCLPEDVQIHPGHGPSSTVGIERRYNPFFQ